MPVQAASELRITSTSLSYLQNTQDWIAYSSGDLLVYSANTKNLGAPYYQSIYFNANTNVVRVDDYEGTGKYNGQCVSLAKSLSQSTVETDKWTTGKQVVTGNVAPGTVISTWDAVDNYDKDKSGNQHTAIFRDYIRNSNDQITGIKVWDQNFVSSKVVGRHNIKRLGTTYNNANNYYVVKVPGDTPTLIRVVGTDPVYHIDTNKNKAWIPTANVFNSWGWSWNDIKEVSQAEFDTYPWASPSKIVFKDGTFLKQSGGYEISLISGGARHPFATWDAYLRYGGASDQSNVKTVTPEEYTLNGLGSTYY